MENARQKALSILSAVNNNDEKDASTQEVTLLGAPIAITDIHCDLQDDAEGSFVVGDWANVTTCRTVLSKQEYEEQQQKESSGNSSEPSSKRARTHESTKGDPVVESSTIDPTIVETIFVAPTIRVAACVQTMFEIVTAPPSADSATSLQQQQQVAKQVQR